MEKIHKRLKNKFIHSIGGEVVTRQTFDNIMKLKASNDDLQKLKREKDDIKKMLVKRWNTDEKYVQHQNLLI